MRNFCAKYKREAILLISTVLAVYGLPLLYRLLPPTADLGDVFLRISAGIVFVLVVWYSFSVKRRLLPVLAVGFLSVGMRRSMYGAETAAYAARGAESAAAVSPWITVLGNLFLIAAAVLIGCLLCRLGRRRENGQ